ncbi:MAG: hypothetical protein BMS9Abin13_541 [Patescibacteria group bacterium]|nr:MAG: hypothetical protein BMS9Abin13_541 [Patescibacteria group bacterium]
MNKTTIWIVIILAIALGAYFLLLGVGEREGVGTAEPAQIEQAAPKIPVDGSAEVNVKEISMVSGGLFFNPNNLTLEKGQPVRISIQNSGLHTFTVDELGVDVPLAGVSGVVEFTPTESGVFEYYCAIPGHREGGMFGSVTII